jgi:hypothetical protein
MAPITPAQEAWRDRVEAAIRLMEPALDLVLLVGDRVSRMVDPNDDWEPPARPNAGRRTPRPAAAPGED